MKNVGWLLPALAAAYGCAVVAPVLRSRLRGKVADLMGWYFAPVMFACPLLIPSGHAGLRALVATVSIDSFFKMVDYFRRWDHFDRSTAFREYYRLLIPFPVFAVVSPDQRRRLMRPQNPGPQVARVLGGTAVFTASLLLLKALSTTTPVRSSFALNHVLVLLAFVPAIESSARALCGLERLAGYDTTPIIRNAYLSRTVSEFWRCYNNRIHHWLYRNVFQVTGGRHAPIRSVILVFVVSGVLHEAAFTVATSRFTGYQFAFFILQAPAALASGRLERLARRGGIAGKVLAHGSTVLFLAVTSVLFFDGVASVFPFLYTSKSPLP